MVDYKRVPFDRALASLAERVPLPTKSWTEHMGDAQNWAFSVSGIAKASLLLQIQARTTQAIANGDSFEDFQVDFQKLMVKAGMAPLAPWRMRLVMLQNMRHSYNAGRYREQTDPETMQRRPWAVYRHDHPITPRLHHLALHGFTARISDPIWQIIYPPGGFNCRCSLRTYSEDQLEDAGFSPSPPLAKDATGIPLVNVDGQQRRAVDKGFEFAPGANDLVHRSRILADAMRRMPPELRQEFMKALGDRIPRPGQPVPDVPVPAPDRKAPKPPAPPKSEIPTTRRTAPTDPTIERMRELLKLKSDVSTDEILEKALKRLKWRNLYDEPPQWVDVEKVRADVIKNGRRDIVPQRVERVKQLILKSLESGDEIPIIELGLWLDRGYEMSDGNHRLEAFYQLGFKQILANVDAEVNPDAPPPAPARPRGRRSSQKPVRPTVQELFSDLPGDAATSLFKQELIQAHEEFTRWEASWENSPAWVKAVISRIEPAGHLAPMEDSNGAFLRRSRIHMNGFTPDKIAAPEVWRHEYGHYIDRMLGIRRAAAKGQVFEDRQWSFISSKDRRFDTSFKRDSGRLIALKAKANQERFNEVNKYLMGRQGRDGMVDRKLLEDLGFDVTDLPDRVVPFNVLIEQPDAKVKLAHEITYLLDRRKINGDAIARRAPKVWQTVYEQTKAAVKAGAPKMDTAELNRFLAAMAVQDVEFLVEHLFNLTKRWAMDPMDLVGSITRNKVSTGHSDEYYRIDGMDRTETFANIIGLLGQPEIGEDLVKYLSPENYKVVKKIFEEFTKSGDVMFDSYGDDVNDNPPKVFSDD